MAKIQSELDRIAREFILGVVDALSAASLAEIAQFASEHRGAGRPRGRSAARATTETPADTTVESSAPKAARSAKSATAAAPQKRASTPGGRRGRRSSTEVAKISEQIVTYVQQAGERVAVSQIAKALKLDISDITRPIVLALEEGLIQKEGEKRMTRYFPTLNRISARCIATC